MFLLVFRRTFERRVRRPAHSALLAPQCGVPKKAIAVVDSRISLRCCCAAPRAISSACSTTRPPILWATKIIGRSFCRQSVSTSCLKYGTILPDRFRSHASPRQIVCERVPMVSQGIGTSRFEHTYNIGVVAECQDTSRLQVISQ